MVRPRRIGIEQLALHAVNQLALDDKLKLLGFNQQQVVAALGHIIARMAAPASELATYHWLQIQSGLGKLTCYDFEGMGLDRLYQVSGQLWKYREAIEAHLKKIFNILLNTAINTSLFHASAISMKISPFLSKIFQGKPSKFKKWS